MHTYSDVQTALVRSRISEREAEAATERLAMEARGGRPAGGNGGVRRWVGRRLIAIGSSLARESLDELRPAARQARRGAAEHTPT